MPIPVPLRSRPRTRTSSLRATARRPRPREGRSNARRTGAPRGKPCPCLPSPTATSVVSRPTPQTPTWCWPVACMASCFVAITVGTRGRRSGKSSARCGRWRGCHPKRTRSRECNTGNVRAGGVPNGEICRSRKSTILCFNGSKTSKLRRRLHFENTTRDCDRQHHAEEVAMLRLGGVASRTYLVAFPAIKEHFQQQGLELDWVLYSSWDALVEAFVRREVDVAWNGPLAYVKIKRRLGDPCQVVAMRDIDVNLVTAFITQPQSAIRTVDDLKGTRFAFGARGSLEAGLLAHHFLKQLGIEPSQDLALATFCEERPTPNADSQRDVVDRIVSGEYDAGAVSSTALERLRAAGLVAPESVRVFWTSPGYSHCCFTAHSDTDRALSRQIPRAFVSMQYDDPLGKTALEAEGCKAFVPGITEGWEVLEAVAEEEGLL